ncbi:MAG: HEXXH motif-containing putative peptide modification protein [Sandaracinaceae bacterium]
MEPPDDLTIPRSTETARRVVSAGLRRLLGDLRTIPLPGALRAAIKEQLAVDPGRVFSALRRPTVGALIRCSRGGRVEPRLAEVLAAELGLDAAPDVPCLSARCPAGAFHPIERDLVLATVDVNPLAMVEAHPDKEGNAIDLGDRAPEEWAASLREALAIIEAHLPVVREEIDLVLQQLVPVGFHEERHLSASYAEAVGTIYLTLHPNPMTMVEAVIHEHQHNKLNALFDLDPLLENDPAERYASPVRPDPRPLFGVLLAVHAFLPVEALYRARVAEGAAHLAKRLEAIVQKNRDGAAVLLAHARPTRIGRGILDEIARLS